MQKVVITDYTFPNLSIEQDILKHTGCELSVHQCKTPESLIKIVQDADYVITQFAPINAQVVNSMEQAKIIVRYGIGYDNVDLNAAALKGIPVCNVPEFCTNEVADHTVGLILATTRCLIQNHFATCNNNWGLDVPLNQMRSFSKMKVGLVGI